MGLFSWSIWLGIRDVFTPSRYGGFPGGSVVKNLPTVQKIWVRTLGWEDPLEKEMPTHFSILAWRIPWTEKSLMSYSPWGRKSQT